MVLSALYKNKTSVMVLRYTIHLSTISFIVQGNVAVYILKVHVQSDF